MAYLFLTFCFASDTWGTGKLLDWACKISFGSEPQRRGEVGEDLVNRQSVGLADSQFISGCHCLGRERQLLLGDESNWVCDLLADGSPIRPAAYQQQGKASPGLSYPFGIFVFSGGSF